MYFSSKIYWASFRFRSLTITLFAFSNLWQATISIAPNKTASFSKINRTCSSSKSFVMLLGIPALSIHLRQEYFSNLCIFHPISAHFINSKALGLEYNYSINWSPSQVLFKFFDKKWKVAICEKSILIFASYLVPILFLIPFPINKMLFW